MWLKRVSFLKLGCVSSYAFSLEHIDCVSACVSLWAPDIDAVNTVDMSCDVIQTHGITGWSLESLERLTRCPLIMRGALTNPLNVDLSPAQILTNVIGGHTHIHFFYVPGVLSFYLVFPPKEIDMSPALHHVGSHAQSFHAALELAMRCDGHTLHQVNTKSPYLANPSYSKIRVIDFSMSEAIHKMMSEPHLFKVVYTSQEYAEFIYGLLKNVYADQVCVSTIEIGPNSVIFEAEETNTSLVLSLALLLKYTSYQKTAANLEDYLSSAWDSIQHNSISWIKEHMLKNVVAAEQEESHSWRQISRKYYDLSLQKKTIVGFDVMVNPVSSVQTMGSGLEELVASYPFYLESIAYNSIQIYPSSSFTPSFDTSWCCRFLARSLSVEEQDVGSFIDRLSCVYPWTCIALLCEYEGKRNFSPFIPLM